MKFDALAKEYKRLVDEGADALETAQVFFATIKDPIWHRKYGIRKTPCKKHGTYLRYNCDYGCVFCRQERRRKPEGTTQKPGPKPKPKGEQAQNRERLVRNQRQYNRTSVRIYGK